MTGILPPLPRPRGLPLLLGGSALAAVAYFSLGGERAEVARVERGELRQAVVASGRVRTPQRVEVASQITGRVTGVAVREGDTVSAGQVLLQFDAAGFDAGDLQHGVDHAQQSLGTLAKHAQQFVLLVVETGFLQQAGHAQDAVHGGADLVAHLRQEGALGLVG